jgi:hypothetical protein
LQDIIVPNAEASPSVAAKRSIARVVLTVAAVLSAIGLDDEAPLYASKIDYVRRDRMLTPEAPAEPIVAQSFPKRSFCLRHSAAQAASPSDHRVAASHLRTSSRLPDNPA